jgi:curli biogenesis system outer membrane secretion channel CsgG
MKRKIPTFVWCAGLLLCGLLAASPAAFADAPVAPKIETLVIGKVKVNDSVAQASAAEGRSNKLDRVSEAMTTQFQAALQQSRKFKLLVGNDLGEIMQQHKTDALRDKDGANAPIPGNLATAKYMVIPTIDDFQDVDQKLEEEGHEASMSARAIRISVVVTIYNINTGEVYETVNTQVKDRHVNGENPNVTKTGDTKDEMLLDLTKKAAIDSANRVVDVFFPAKILSHIDKTVQLNRGDGTSIAVGQVWDAFAQGEEIKDPDTGEVLGKQEVPSGKIRITAVYPKFSAAEIIEDTGIDKGNIVRLHVDKTDVTPKN